MNNENIFEVKKLRWKLEKVKETRVTVSTNINPEINKLKPDEVTQRRTDSLNW